MLVCLEMPKNPGRKKKAEKKEKKKQKTNLNLHQPGIPSASSAKTQLAALTVTTQVDDGNYDRDLFSTWDTIEGTCNTVSFVPPPPQLPKPLHFFLMYLVGLFVVTNQPSSQNLNSVNTSSSATAPTSSSTRLAQQPRGLGSAPMTAPLGLPPVMWTLTTWSP